MSRSSHHGQCARIAPVAAAAAVARGCGCGILRPVPLPPPLAAVPLPRLHVCVFAFHPGLFDPPCTISRPILLLPFRPSHRSPGSAEAVRSALLLSAGLAHLLALRPIAQGWLHSGLCTWFEIRYATGFSQQTGCAIMQQKFQLTSHLLCKARSGERPALVPPACVPSFPLVPPRSPCPAVRRAGIITFLFSLSRVLWCRCPRRRSGCRRWRRRC